ncbi:MAG: GWxTD domain-containing protein [Saprospiraceae bacterium]|nr:GWxTD domain-containing protein [Saprospiraceae bacterium]
MKSLYRILALLAFPMAAHALDAGISWAVFATPDKPYLEVNIEIAAASVTFKAMDSTHLQAGVETLILIKSGDKIVNFEKYVLQSPLVFSPQDLLDVKRMNLPEGEYTLEVVCKDMFDATNMDTYKAQIKVTAQPQIRLSEVQLLRSFKRDDSANPFTKNGFFLEPLPFAFYDRNATQLAFYAEIYHADKAMGAAANYTARYFIERDMNNGQYALVSTGSQRKQAAPIDALLVQMDISKLESGNYRLSVELRNPANEVVYTQTRTFQRSNPFLNFADNDITDDVLKRQFVQTLTEDELIYCLKALSPLALGDEPEILKNLLKEKDAKKMRYHIFRHFARVDANNPGNAYQQYILLANAANDKFKSGFRYGFENDRGRTFMKYGKPDDMIREENDPSAPPYEIWIYYNFPKTKQKNVKFLFYNPTLAGEDFVLLHSNARGEINNPRWERDLYKRNAEQEYDGDNYHDSKEMKRNVNRNARVYFEDL